MKSQQNLVFTLMVDNEFGVLTRITALIRRAGWNIRSLAVAETAKQEISRLTICLECRHHTLESVLEKLGRLDCVREITLYSPENQVARELALARVGSGDVDGVLAAFPGCEPKVLHQGSDWLIVSLVGSQDDLDALLHAAKELWPLEIARTGTISMML